MPPSLPEPPMGPPYSSTGPLLPGSVPDWVSAPVAGLRAPDRRRRPQLRPTGSRNRSQASCGAAHGAGFACGLLSGRVMVRPIGVLRMWDEKGLDEKILAVPVADRRLDGVRHIDDLQNTGSWKSRISSRPTRTSKGQGHQSRGMERDRGSQGSAEKVPKLSLIIRPHRAIGL